MMLSLKNIKHLTVNLHTAQAETTFYSYKFSFNINYFIFTVRVSMKLLWKDMVSLL